MDEQALLMETRKNRRKKGLKRYQKIIIGLVVILVLASAVGYNYFNNYFKATVDKETEKHLAVVKKDKPVNILLLGTDERGKERARTDTIIIISIDKNKNSVKLLSIPRDTYVNIPGHGKDKINAAHAYGGIPLTLDTIQNFTGQPIHYYARTNFQGFEAIVDTLGGVNINVERNIYGSGVTVSKGVHRLNGQQALAYVRNRKVPQGDITRIKQQQNLLKAIASEMLQGKTVLKLPSLLPDLKKAVETNMSLTDMLDLVNKAKNYNSGSMPTATVPGKPIMLHGISYWEPDMVKTKEIINETFDN